MAVEFIVEKKRLLSVLEKAFVKLMPTLEALQRATGIRVDAYGTSVVQPDHAKLWAASLRRLEQTLANTDQLRGVCNSVATTLEAAAAAGHAIVVEGE